MFDAVLNWYVFLLFELGRKLGMSHEAVDFWFRWVVAPGTVFGFIAFAVWQGRRMQGVKHERDDPKNEP